MWIPSETPTSGTFCYTAPVSGLPTNKGGDLVILGGGGHALVVAEAAAAVGMRAIGFLDDAPDAPLGQGGGVGESDVWAERLGGFADLEGVISHGAPSRVALILAIGHGATRRGLLERVRAMEGGSHRAWATIVHPSAVVSLSARLGAGVFVGPRAVVHTRAVIGDHAIVNTGAIVEHECEVGENSHIAPGSVLGGRAKTGADALVGIGARVMLNMRIGRGATVGCGAVVIRDVEAGKTVVGVPAREIRSSA